MIGAYNCVATQPFASNHSATRAARVLLPNYYRQNTRLGASERAQLNLDVVWPHKPLLVQIPLFDRILKVNLIHH